MFRNVTNNDLGPRTKKLQKEVLSEAALAAVPPVKMAKYLKRLAEMEKKFKKIGILKPGQKIPTKTVRPDPKKDHLRPGGDNPKDPDTFKISRQKAAKKKKKKPETIHETAKREDWTHDDWDLSYGQDPKPHGVYNSPRHKRRVKEILDSDKKKK